MQLKNALHPMSTKFLPHLSFHHLFYTIILWYRIFHTRIPITVAFHFPLTTCSCDQTNYAMRQSENIRIKIWNSQIHTYIYTYLWDVPITALSRCAMFFLFFPFLFYRESERERGNWLWGQSYVNFVKNINISLEIKNKQIIKININEIFKIQIL